MSSNATAPDAAASVAALLQDPLAAKQCFAWGFTGVICLGLACAYRRHGWTRIALIYFWLGSLVGTQMSVHRLLRVLGLPYPAFLTFVQFATLCVPAVLYMCLAAHTRPGASPTSPGVPFLSRRFVGLFARRVLPVVLAHTIATVGNNISLGLIDPGLNAVLGSMTPAITIVLSAAFGERLAAQAWVAVALVVCGGILAIRGGVEAASVEGAERPFLGIAMSLGAMCLRSLKNVAIQRSVRGRSGVRAAKAALKGVEDDDPVLTPLQLLLFQAPAAATVLIVLASLDPVGLAVPLRALRLGAAATWGAAVGAEPVAGGASPWLVPVLVLNIFCAGSLNLCGISIVQRIGATAMQIVGKANVFIILSASAAYMGERVNPTEIAGAVVVLFACYLFPGAPRPDDQRAVAMLKARSGAEEAKLEDKETEMV